MRTKAIDFTKRAGKSKTPAKNFVRTISVPKAFASPYGASATYIAIGNDLTGKRPELVNHPTHYGGDVPHEVKKCLRAWGLEADALLYQAVKYIARWNKKHATVQEQLEDLKKARFR